MTFREQLDKAREMGLSICDLAIANECECIFNFEYTEEEFEQLCSLARTIYLKSEYLTENAIAYAINDLIIEEEKTISEVLETKTYTLLNIASNYI